MGRFCDHSITFVGAVGDVVGQHWRDIHVLRTRGLYEYIRTIRQGVCRTEFQKAVALSHVAQAAMYPAPMFATGRRSAWNGRVSTAMINVQNGITGLAAVPIVLNDVPIAWSDLSIDTLTKKDGDLIDIKFTSGSADGSMMFAPDVWFSITILNNSDVATPWLANVVYGRNETSSASNTLTVLDIKHVIQFDVQFVVCSAKQKTIDDVPQFSGVRTLAALPF